MCCRYFLSVLCILLCNLRIIYALPLPLYASLFLSCLLLLSIQVDLLLHILSVFLSQFICFFHFDELESIFLDHISIEFERGSLCLINNVYSFNGLLFDSFPFGTHLFCRKRTSSISTCAIGRATEIRMACVFAT